MKKQDVVGVAMSTLYRTDKASKTQKAIRRITGYLAEQSFAGASQAIEQIVGIMAREVFRTRILEIMPHPGDGLVESRSYATTHFL